MLAVIQKHPGGADTLQLAEQPQPSLLPGQLLISVRAAGVNRADIAQREGRYPAPAGASPLLGLEVAGTVAAVADAPGFAVGDEVFGLVPGGGYAEYAVLDAALAIRKPAWLGWAEAASLPEAWMTAWLNLAELGQLKPGERVLIHAGASGVGAAAIQLARFLGAEVIASAGTLVKLDYCRNLGAQQVFNWREQADFSTFVRQHGGVDLILDPVGGQSLAANMACMNPDGRMILIGIMAGAQSSINLGQMLVKRLSLRGSTLRAQGLDVKRVLAEALASRIVSAIGQGKIQLTIDSCYALHEVQAAHLRMEQNQNQGKIILLIQ